MQQEVVLAAHAHRSSSLPVFATTWRRRLAIWSGLFLVLQVAACGGGSDNSSAPASNAHLQTGFIQGTAASGTALAGASVVIKDALGHVFTSDAPSDAQGHYRINLIKAQAPYLIQATSPGSGGSIRFHAVATEEDLNGTINVNQLTQLLAANLFGGDPEASFREGDLSSLTRGKIDQALADLQTKLLPILDAAQLNSEAFLRTAFAPDHTGIDLVLDILEVEADFAQGQAYIVNNLDGGRVLDLLNPGTGADSAQLPSPSSDLLASLFSRDMVVSARAKQAWDLISQLNKALKRADTDQGLAALTQWCDSGDYLDSLNESCQAWAESLAALTHRGDRPLMLKQVVAFDATEVDNVHAEKTRQHQISDVEFGVVFGTKDDPRLADKPAVLLKQTANRWVVAGDRRLVNVSARGFVSLRIIRDSALAVRRLMESGVMLMSSTPSSNRATQVIVEGPGLSGNWGLLGLFSQPDTKDVPPPPDMSNGNPIVYTVRVFKDDTEIASYKTRLLSSRVVAPEDIENEVFPQITGRIDAAACAAGQVSSAWELPPGQVPTDVTIFCEEVGFNSSLANMTHIFAGEGRAGTATGTLWQTIPHADRSEVALRSVGSDGLLYRTTQSFEIASRGMTLSVTNLGTASSHGATNQAWLDFYNTYYPSAAIKALGGDGLLSAVCRITTPNLGYLLYVNTAPFAEITAITDRSALSDSHFEATRCTDDTSGHALTIGNDGTVSLTSTTQGQNGALGQSSFSAMASASLLSDEGAAITSNGARTWLHPFQALWNGARSLFIIETTQRPDQSIWTTVWRELTS